MNESNMPREWWHDQDQDNDWIAEQELRNRQQEEEEKKAKAGQIWEQLTLDFDGEFGGGK